MSSWIARLTVIGLWALVSSAHAGPPALNCAQAARRDEQQCMKDAREQCHAKYQTTFGGCFGGEASCATTCQNDQRKCQADPRVVQVTCEKACTEGQTRALRACKQDDAETSEACITAARSEHASCRQKCQGESGPKLQACMHSFGTCLQRCAAQLSGRKDGKSAEPPTSKVPPTPDH